MPRSEDELLEIADQMDKLATRGQHPEIQQSLDRLQEAAERVGKAWSGSFLGYHANVYYLDLVSPPPGAHFSQEWGLMQSFPSGTAGEWVELNPDELKAAIKAAAGNPDMAPASELRAEVLVKFEASRIDALSILEPRRSQDQLLQRLWDQLDKLSIKERASLMRAWVPKDELISRDTIAIGQGFWSPPHHSVLSEVLVVRGALDQAKKLASISRQAGRHIGRHRKPSTSGYKVFVGHGGSPVWLELSNFLQDRLGLEVDEFNRVQVAGIAHTERLIEMLDAAAIAFVVMTGEDEQPDGSFQPRMNAVYEVGLFQGRLGFSRAIVLLEEGCAEFSNIEGLGQLRFPKGRVSAVFEEVRHVLERENVLAKAR